MTEALTTKLGRVPVWRRRAALVLGPVVVVVLVAPIVYLRGGDRLSGAGANVGTAVTIGEEFHAMVQLDTGGGTLELVSARPTGVSPDLRVDVTLVRLRKGNPIGSDRGPLDADFPPIVVRGHRLRSSYASDRGYALDLRESDWVSRVLVGLVSHAASGRDW